MENKEKKPGLKKWVKGLIIGGASLLTVILTICVIGVSYATYPKRYKYNDPEHVEVQHDKLETVKAVGRSLYDVNGDVLHLKGVNYGNYLIQEEWMSINSLGPLLNEDGSYASVNYEGTVTSYNESYQEDIEKALRENPNNFTEEQIEKLWDIYYDAYCQEVDFQNIKNSGLNLIRLPVDYHTFLKGDDEHLVMKDNAFERIDWFLEMSKKYELYVIIDMHGVPGGQNGYEHSGVRSVEFWDNELYQNTIINLWRDIAEHYATERADLASTIASYDLINEPANNYFTTGKKQWDVMDKIYDAIREVDTDHVITFEGCWFFNNLPDPKDYGWENVMYEYHFYNWNEPLVSNDMFYALQFLTFEGHDFEVPKYVGEFTFFDNKDEWIKWLNYYDQMGFNWSFWSYKAVSVGWWDTSWGMYVQKLFHKEGDLKLDLRTATYEEIRSVWADEGTFDLNGRPNYTASETGTLSIIKAYFEQCD